MICGNYNDVFDFSHHATTLGRKVVRAATLIPRYYLLDVPRYLLGRSVLNLPTWDVQAILNPLREFSRSGEVPHPLPPHLDKALVDLRRVGCRLTMPPQRLKALLAMWWYAWSVTEGAAIEFVHIGGRLPCSLLCSENITR